MKKEHKRSLHQRLLFWLSVPLCSLWLIMTLVSSERAYDFTTAAYDHELANSADSIAARLKVRDGQLTVEVPENARKLLLHGNRDKFYYEVFDETGHYLAGEEVMTFNKNLLFDEPVFSTTKIDGEDVRVSSIKVRTEEDADRVIIIQVAETLASRKEFARQLLISMVAPDMLLIVVCAIIVYAASKRALRPLINLRDAIAQRSPADLSPVPERDVPPEVEPLVEAINSLLHRLRLDIEAQKRFVANAAHQFRTPVAGLKTYVQYAKRLANTAELSNVLAQIDHGTDRLTRIANKLLTLARAEPDTAITNRSLNAVDLNEVAASAVKELNLQAREKNIELIFQAGGANAIISGNSHSLFELITNLVENAVIYTHNGGKVLVAVDTDLTDRQSSVILKVEDNGPGIPESERERVFERFYRILGTDSSGSGLGLAIVKEIADSHQAQINLTVPDAGQGTIVGVRFSALSKSVDKQ